MVFPSTQDLSKGRCCIKISNKYVTYENSKESAQLEIYVTDGIEIAVAQAKTSVLANYTIVYTVNGTRTVYI